MLVRWFMLTPAEILGPGGRIAARLPNYERRQQQLEMAEAVSSALAEGRHLAVEAGTGVGKSFAYLVPAILAATEPAENETRRLPIVVSTHTISLQEQLLAKDLPLLRSVMPREFTAVLAKGRRNYVSLRRLDLALSRARSLFAVERRTGATAGLAGVGEGQQRRQLERLDVPTVGLRVGRGGQRQRQLYGPRLPVSQAMLLLPCSPPHPKRPNPYRQPRLAVLQRPGAAARRRQHPAQLRLADLGRGPHRGIGGRRALGHGGNVGAGRVHLEQALQRPHQQRAVDPLQAPRAAARRRNACRTCADEFFDRVFEWLLQHHGDTARVRQPQIVAEPTQPRTGTAGGPGTAGGKHIRRRVSGMISRRPHERLVRLAGELEAWLACRSDARVGLLGRAPGRGAAGRS